MKKTILRLLLYFVVLDVCVITLYPYFAMLCTALKNRVEIFSGGTVLPVVPLWSNFIDIWSRAPMAKYMLNSILIAGGSTVIAMLCGIPAAYALAGCAMAGTMAAFVPQFLGTLAQGIGSGALFLVIAPALDGVKLKEHVGA